MRYVNYFPEEFPFMPSTTNEALNQVLIDLDKSLLSYVAEAWPWSSQADATVRGAVEELAVRRRESVGRLADQLVEREWPVDFGTYPTEYTDLHYVGLDYLLSQLVHDQKRVTAGIERTLRAASGDAQAKPLLEEILNSERDTLARLQKLPRSRTPVSAA